jgi:hypothetical protein
MTRRMVVAVAVAALAATACGERGEPGALGSAAEAPTVSVGLDDNGRTVSLDRGENVVIRLLQDPAGGWSLARYPEKLLALVSADKENAVYRFEARATGRGRLIALNTSGGPPDGCVQRLGADASSPCRGADAGAKPVLPGPGVFVVDLVVE